MVMASETFQRVAEVFFQYCGVDGHIAIKNRMFSATADKVAGIDRRGKVWSWIFVAERQLTLARSFKAGMRYSPFFLRRRATTEDVFKRRSRDAGKLFELFPGVETPGYSQPSLRDEEIAPHCYPTRHRHRRDARASQHVQCEAYVTNQDVGTVATLFHRATSNGNRGPLNVIG
jgi:hypothetical protein